MGELVEGLGDEVIFFVAFLVLSLVIITLITSYRRQSPQADRRTREARADDQPSEQDQQREGDEGAQISAERQQHPSGGLETGLEQDASQTEEIVAESISSDTSNGSGLRSRFHTSDPGAQAAEESAGNEINIRLVQAGPGNAIPVKTRPDCSLGQLRRMYFQEELSQHRPVKFIYQGRVLSNDDQTLQDLNITEGGAMHVHVGRPHPPGAQPERQQPEAEFLDLSNLFVPLFGVILGIVWVALLSYPEIFSFMTKIFLFALSLGYVFLAYSTTF